MYQMPLLTEAPPPKAPLYMYIDEAYKDWWTNHLGKDPIPKECNVVRVNNAIQGHPEAPRLWENYIDQILCELGMVTGTCNSSICRDFHFESGWIWSGMYYFT
jgi:hypothetical protein